MIRFLRRPRKLVASVGVIAIGLVAISSGTAGAQSSGEVKVTGSSTVEPITSLVAELFAEEQPGRVGARRRPRHR